MSVASTRKGALDSETLDWQQLFRAKKLRSLQAGRSIAPVRLNNFFTEPDTERHADESDQNT